MPRRLARSVADRRSGSPGQLPLRAGLGHRAQPPGQEPDAPGEVPEVVAAEERLLPQQAVQGLLREKQDPAGGAGGEDGGELRRVVVEGGRAEELPGPQQADGQGAVGHLDLSGEEHAQAAPELAGSIEQVPGGEGLERDAGQGGQAAEQGVLRPQEQGTAAQEGALLLREFRGHGRALLSKKCLI